MTVIVNPANPVQRLSLDQLRAIYSCTVKDWSRIDPALSGPIHPWTFGGGSGTRRTFEQKVGVTESTCDDDDLQKQPIDNGWEMSHSIADDERAIGIVGLPFVGYNRALPISQGSSAAVPPTPTNVFGQKYPISRDLFLYMPASPDQKPVAGDFIEKVALQRQLGQRAAIEAGFVSSLVPPPDDGVAPSDDQCPSCNYKLLPGATCTVDPRYCGEVAGARRFPIDATFQSNSFEINTVTNQRLDLLAQDLKSIYRGKTLLVFGFSDNVGDPAKNRVLAGKRGVAVQEALRARGVNIEMVLPDPPFGEEVPFPDPQADENRRVELWVR